MPGKVIKKKRKELKISQAEMAERLHMSQSNYSKIENNRVDLRAKTAKEIAFILHMKLEDLLPDDAVLESSMLHQERLQASANDLQVFLKSQLDLMTDMLREIMRRMDEKKV